MTASIGTGGPGGTRLDRARNLALLALALVACVAAYRAYRSFVFEDAYITYRYAENVARGNGFVFNPGERVLGTTTPLYALLLACLRLVGIDVPSAGTALSVGSLAGVGLAGAWILRRRAHPDLGVLYAVLIVWGGFFTYYLSGMETAFYSLLLFGSALAASQRRFVWTGILLGLAFLTRYDAVTFAAPLLFLAWLDERAHERRREGRGAAGAALRGPLKSALIAAALALPWLVFATAYFGSPLPNTLAAKKDIAEPAVYLWESALMFPRHLVPSLTAAIDLHMSWLDLAAALLLLAPIPFQLRALARSEKGALVFLLHPLLLFLGYAWIGAAPCLWHVVPAFFSLSLLALLAWGHALRRLRARPWSAWVASLLLGASFVFLPGNLMQQANLLRSTDSYQKRERGYEEMAAWMRARGLLDLVVCTAEPGYFTHLTDCRVVDLGGLVTQGVRPDTDLLELVTSRGVQAVLNAEPAAGFKSVCEAPQLLYVRDDVVRERLADFARPWLEHAAPESTCDGARALDWDFEPGVEHGWRGSNELVGRPELLRFAGEPVSDAYLNTSPEVTGETIGKLMSPPFRIEFEELAFRLGLGGTQRRQRGLLLELLVNELPVLAIAPVEQGAMTEVRWPVHAWHGMEARLRITDFAVKGWLALDRVRAVRKRHAGLIDDFEAPDFEPRWTATFADTPVPFARTADALGVQFILGRATASSLDVTGAARLVSTPFRVEHDELAFVVQGFGGAAARIELSVDGETVRSFVPGRENGLHAVAFDLAPFRGREAVLAVYDDDPDPARGIGVDALALFDRCE